MTIRGTEDRSQRKSLDSFAVLGPWLVTPDEFGDPGDAELWTLRGNFEEPGLWAAGRGQRGSASAIAFYERAIALVPGHFGAHHYLIHTYEMIGRFDEAEKHGKIYAEAAPSVPHALHMPTHIYTRLGDWDGLEPFPS